MGRKLTDEQVNKIASRLYGSCLSLDEVIEDETGLTFGELDYEDCLAIDDLVFECQACNWWFGSSEYSDKVTHENYCESCGEDEY